MTHTEINTMSKRDLVVLVETLQACASDAWRHADELESRVNELWERGDVNAAYTAQIAWQMFDSALKMANLQQFKPRDNR